MHLVTPQALSPLVCPAGIEGAARGRAAKQKQSVVASNPLFLPFHRRNQVRVVEPPCRTCAASSQTAPERHGAREDRSGTAWHVELGELFLDCSGMAGVSAEISPLWWPAPAEGFSNCPPKGLLCASRPSPGRPVQPTEGVARRRGRVQRCSGVQRLHMHLVMAASHTPPSAVCCNSMFIQCWLPRGVAALDPRSLTVTPPVLHNAYRNHG